MELRPISDLAGWYARELSEAFPENERKPLADMVSIWCPRWNGAAMSR